MNGIVFLKFFRVGLPLVYRKVTNFCIIILYPVTSLKVFISCWSFLVGYFRGIYAYNNSWILLLRFWDCLGVLSLLFLFLSTPPLVFRLCQIFHKLRSIIFVLASPKGYNSLLKPFWLRVFIKKIIITDLRFSIYIEWFRFCIHFCLRSFESHPLGTVPFRPNFQAFCTHFNYIFWMFVVLWSFLYPQILINH